MSTFKRASDAVEALSSHFAIVTRRDVDGVILAEFASPALASSKLSNGEVLLLAGASTSRGPDLRAFTLEGFRGFDSGWVFDVSGGTLEIEPAIPAFLSPRLSEAVEALKLSPEGVAGVKRHVAEVLTRIEGAK